MDVLASIVPIRAALDFITGLLQSRPHSPAVDGQQSFAQALEQSLGATLVSKRDVDGNGTLSIAEAGIDEAMFQQFDMDHNGELTAGEINLGIAQWRSERRAETATDTLLRRHDFNQDGQLNVTELGAPRDVFARLDADGDGMLSRREITEAYSDAQAPGRVFRA